MWLLFGSVLITSLSIGTIGIILTSGVIENSSVENMNLLCKTNADKVDIALAKVEDSVDTLSHTAVSELSDIAMLKDNSLRAAYSAGLEKNALHHIENIDGAVAIYLCYNTSYIGESDGFFYVKNKDTNQFENRPLTDISLYAEDDIEHVGWWHIPTKQKTATWIEAYYNANIDHDMISYVVPLYKEGQLIGVIGADISTEHIESLIKEISIFNSGKAAVLKSDGTIVYHPNFKRGHLLGAGDPGFDGVVEKLADEEHTGELIKYELDGVEKQLASCKLRNGMLMVCFAPVSEIYREQHMLSFLTLACTLIVISLASVAAYFVSRAFARPIKKLNEAAKHLTDGEFDFDIQTDLRDEIGELTSTFIETRKILQHQIHLLDTEAHRDGLTGARNKSAFMDKEIEINREIISGNANFSIAVFDVNKLKVTNDIFGHMAGDKLLSTVSDHLSSSFGEENIFRIGGDEFVVILQNEDSTNCNALMTHCIEEMKTLSLEGYPECRVSCAYGLSQFDAKIDHQLSDVLRRADKEMYKNKAITKKETFPWQEGIKGIKQLQMEKYCQLLQTLSGSTDDYLFIMNTETGGIRFFGEDSNSYDIVGGLELANGVLDMLNYVHANDRALVKQAVSSIMSHDTEVIDINFRMHDKNNANMRWVNCRGSVIKDETDSHFVVIGRISQNAVKHLYNPITTLFNKAKLKKDLQNESSDGFSCLMLLDIDNLSEINLKHGSVYGDRLLKALAKELEKRFSMTQIYHAEKDRFVVLLDVNSSKKAKKIFDELKDTLAGKCSVSASVVPNDKSVYVKAENIYDYAVQTLNHAKKNSIGQIVFFSEDSLLERISEVELLEELEKSVKKKCSGFSLVYQPQISAEDYSVVSAEALLRFQSKSKGPIFPDRFIPLLEQTGLIHEVGFWVLNEALSQCKLWRQVIPDFKISVNLSPKQLEKKRIAAQIKNLLSKHALPGEALILEITESAQLDANEDVHAILSKLRQAGIQIAIDDFGTGYSNLGNLKHIHANILKVDRIFIRGIKENGYNYNLIHNVIEFAKSNELQVCLEGVENKSEFVVLSELHPDILQGYLFDKPCSADLFEAKYFNSDTEHYRQRIGQVEMLKQEQRHAPLMNMEMKTILSGLDIGLWIVRINIQTGEGELYSDETMRRLLGVSGDMTAKECFRYWKDHIGKEHQSAIHSMFREMANSEEVFQLEYSWHHPKKDLVTIRFCGRCTEKNDKMIVLEGFHRVLED